MATDLQWICQQCVLTKNYQSNEGIIMAREQIYYAPASNNIANPVWESSVKNNHQ
jgi:hypothetical protein